jgi:asparagine synthetase B (glutamine-hydrolysing)
MSVGYLLSKTKGKKITAFTLLVNDDEADIVQSRKLAQHYGIDLVEVQIVPSGNNLSIKAKKYDSSRKLLYEKEIANNISKGLAIGDSTAICANPYKDNVLCAVSMYLIAKAIKSEGIKTVFCGEGPNEMLNDYGKEPSKHGFSSSDLANIRFREIMTFGYKRISKQGGRVGLGNAAVSRMSKVFAYYGIRLESPYFDKDIARILTRVPHLTSYDTIKQHLIGEVFSGEGLDHFIIGTSKMMFQDGAGIRGVFSDYDDVRIRAMFQKIYGISIGFRMKNWAMRFFRR